MRVPNQPDSGDDVPLAQAIKSTEAAISGLRQQIEAAPVGSLQDALTKLRVARGSIKNRQGAAFVKDALDFLEGASLRPAEA